MIPYIIVVVLLPPLPRTNRSTAAHDEARARADTTADWSNLIVLEPKRMRR